MGTGRNLGRAGLDSAEPGEFVLVVMQVYHAPVWQFLEPLDCAVVRITLKFNRADETATGAGFKPALYEL